MKTRTEAIFELSSPYDNQYQGKTPRYLFVCSAGLLRSPTAATVASQMGFNVRSCGSDYHYALVPISVNLIHWAHKIFFMNIGNYDESLSNFFGDRETCEMLKDKAVIWHIEDDFDYMNPQLVLEVEKLLT
jgi:predicted protein tyrosine phosphatase